MGQWEVGAKVRLECDFKLADVLTDTTPSVEVLQPDGTDYGSLTPQQQSTGVYYVDITCDQVGEYSWRWVGTGAVNAVNEGYFGISPSRFS